MKKALLLISLLITTHPIQAKHIHLEKEYQEAWCKKIGGVLEYKNPDLSRVDCLTNDYAIEFDFASKWAEGVGQSLYYSIITFRKPVVVLISENGKKDSPYIKRARTVAKHYNIGVYVITPSYLN